MEIHTEVLIDDLLATIKTLIIGALAIVVGRAFNQWASFGIYTKAPLHAQIMIDFVHGVMASATIAVVAILIWAFLQRYIELEEDKR